MTQGELMDYLDRQQELFYNDGLYYNTNKCNTLIVNDVYIQFIKIEVNDEINHLVIDDKIYMPFSKIRSIDII